MKGIIHSCDFKTFFKEKGIKKIKGFVRYNHKSKEAKDYDVNKIKMIITMSQFKALTFMKHMNFIIII